MIEAYKEQFLVYLETKVKVEEPKNLYSPIKYILDLGGKKLRPILVLMAIDVFGGEPKKGLDAALAVEVFHNFTLVHDDIMDDAPLRRGQVTVHEKWNINTGILSGDAMLIKAYQFLESYEPALYFTLNKIFSQTAIEVCEGQQYDIDFETRDNVTIAEYIEMIKLKTSVLVAAAMKMGALIADASSEQADFIYEFGLSLGLAFQLQDDYLDAFGDPKTFGKQVGGDIIENKKTYLYLKALELSDANDEKLLRQFFISKLEENEEKVSTVKSIFMKVKADVAIKEQIQVYTDKAFDALASLSISEDKKALLRDFGLSLMKRDV